MSEIKPLPGYVLIEPIKDESETASGWKLPDSSQDVPMKGKVTAISDKDAFVYKPELSGGNFSHVYEKINININLDDVVLFKKYSGQTVKQDGKELKLVEFKDLLAVIE